MPILRHEGLLGKRMLPWTKHAHASCSCGNVHTFTGEANYPGHSCALAGIWICLKTALALQAMSPSPFGASTDVSFAEVIELSILVEQFEIVGAPSPILIEP